MTIDQLIDKVLLENNKEWLNPEQAQWNIDEGRVPITRKDIHDVIKQLPIHIYGDNLWVYIAEDGIVVKQQKPDEF